MCSDSLFFCSLEDTRRRQPPFFLFALLPFLVVPSLVCCILVCLVVIGSSIFAYVDKTRRRVFAFFSSAIFRTIDLSRLWSVTLFTFFGGCHFIRCLNCDSTFTATPFLLVICCLFFCQECDALRKFGIVVPGTVKVATDIIFLLFELCDDVLQLIKTHALQRSLFVLVRVGGS